MGKFIKAVDINKIINSGKDLNYCNNNGNTGLDYISEITNKQIKKNI